MTSPSVAQESGRSRRPRILFLAHALGYGGAERQLVLLACELARRGHPVSVALMHSGGHLDQVIADAGIPIHDLGKGSRLSFVRFGLRYMRLLRREPGDVLHSYLVLPNLLALLARWVAPRMQIVWGVRASDMAHEEYGLVSNVLFRLSCPLARFADVIVVNSSAGLEYHARQGYPRNRMRLVPNAIDTSAFCPMPEERDALRAEWAIGAGTVVVGILARLDPMKDHGTFLRAAAQVEGDVRFVIVGSGDATYSSSMRTLADELGLGERVLWAGARRDAVRVLNAFDITVCSSQWGEGFPNVIGESLACGTPCVTTAVGDSEVVIGDPRYVVARRDPAALAAAIMSLVRAGPAARAQIAAAGRARIESNFSTDRMVDSTLEALSSCIRR